MGKLTFIIGGARSGKSRCAVKLIGKNKRAAFIATAQAKDKEMALRIAFHKKARPKSWHTFEEPLGVSGLLKKIGARYECILIDCLTLLVSNLMLENLKQKAVEREVAGILSALGKVRADAVIVSNEVGLGIVPKNSLARDFRDIAGRVNQMVAEKADEVFFVVSGILWRIK